ncbi:hypothetical protein IPM19_03145 [bacterium]|nr:MAG: hypothetical protein IPM19_03145 [bacterium]
MNLDNRKFNLDNDSFENGLSDSDKATLAKLAQLKSQANQISPDRNFSTMLRAEIADKANQQAAAHYANSASSNNKPPLTLFSFMNKIIIPLVAVAVIASGTGYWFASKNDPALLGVEGNELLSGKYAVTEVDENSFGDLNKVSIIADPSRNNQGGNNTAADMAAPGAEGERAAMPVEPGGGTGGGYYPYPEAVSYKFKYVGSDLANLSETESVLKRSKPVQPPTLISRLIRMFSFGLVDLGKFENPRMESVSFLEDKEYGLAAYINLNYGTINMNQNWEKWPQYQYGCYGYSCGTQPRLTPSDIPGDDELIRIAAQFMNDYQISREGLGKPFVYDYSNWRVLYDQAPDKSSIYIPEQLNVIYPLVLEEKDVYDESGMNSGINITIDIRSKRVSAMYGLETKQYQKSNYKGETDQNRIIEIAERGGYRNYVYEYPGKVVTLELGTPTVNLVKMWYSKDNKGPGEELYIPALVFPINNAAQNNYWRKNVIVPLVRDILDNENPQYPGQPIPLVDPPATTNSEPAVLPAETTVPSGE